MKKFDGNSLFQLIRDYLKQYLPVQRNLSTHTIRSYQRALEQLFDFIKTQKKIPLNDVTFEMLTAEMLNAFLDHIELERGCSVTTRNSRLAAIRAFLVFAAERDIATVATLNELKKVPTKKQNEIEVVSYMSMEAITAIVEQPDAETQKGLRDRFFMMLMYDLGARIQEMINLRLRDIRVSKETTIELYGKGRKFRSVPIMERTVKHLGKYLDVFHAEAHNNDSPLFYTISRGQRNPISASCVRLFLSQYAKMAREGCQDVPFNVHPHMFRNPNLNKIQTPVLNIA